MLKLNPWARIGSIGCGGCRELRLLLPELRCTTASFTLIDADQWALSFAEACLGPLAARCTFVQGRVSRVLTRLRHQGSFDLALAGGLFDYLPDRWAIETLRHALPSLARALDSCSRTWSGAIRTGRGSSTWPTGS